jgi:hypothetical protein
MADVPRTRSILLALCSCVALGGCPGTLDDPDSFRPCTPETVPTSLFPKACGNSLCHDSSNPEAELDLISPDVAARLVNQTSVDTACATRLLIDPNNVENSFLIEKITKSKPECGDPMPAAGSLSDQEIQCVRDWVASVAGSGTGGSSGGGGTGGTTDGGDDSSAGAAGAAGTSGSAGAAGAGN